MNNITILMRSIKDIYGIENINGEKLAKHVERLWDVYLDDLSYVEKPKEGRHAYRDFCTLIAEVMRYEFDELPLDSVYYSVYHELLDDIKEVAWQRYVFRLEEIVEHYVGRYSEYDHSQAERKLL